MKRERVQQKPEGESLAVQSFADEADINRKMARHLKGPNRGMMLGAVPQTPREPRFLDLSSADTYHDMLNKVSQIDTKFQSLPARVRQRFRNNPELLLRFVEDPANAREAVKLGLISDPEVVREVQEAVQMDLEEQARLAGEEAAKKAATAPEGGNA